MRETAQERDQQKKHLGLAHLQGPKMGTHESEHRQELQRACELPFLPSLDPQGCSLSSCTHLQSFYILRDRGKEVEGGLVRSKLQPREDNSNFEFDIGCMKCATTKCLYQLLFSHISHSSFKLVGKGEDKFCLYATEWGISFHFSKTFAAMSKLQTSSKHVMSQTPLDVYRQCSLYLKFPSLSDLGNTFLLLNSVQLLFMKLTSNDLFL